MRKFNPWMSKFLAGLLLLALPAGILAQATTETSPAPVDPTAVLKAIPENATAFLVVRNLAEMDANVVGLAQSLGISLGPMGMFPGPLMMAKSYLGISDGLVDNGSMAFVLLSCANVKSMNDVPQQLVIFVPCHNVDALTAMMSPQRDGEVLKLTVAGESFIGGVKEGFLILARQPESLKAVLAARDEGVIKSMSPDRIQAYSEQDLFGWANPDAISPAIIAEISDTLKGLMAMANPARGMQDADTSIEQMTKVFKESREMAAGLKLNQRVGLLLSFYMNMKPDTDLGKQMASMRMPQVPLLVGLPNEPVVFAVGSSAGDEAETSRQVKIMLDQLLREDQLGDELDTEKVKQLKEALVVLLSTVKQMSVAVTALPPEGNQGLIGVVFAGKVEDSGAWRNEFRRLIHLGKDLVVQAAKKQENISTDEVKAITEAIQIRENADQSEDAVIDEVVFDLTKIPDLDEQTLQEIQDVLGPECGMARIGTVGKDYVLLTYGGGKTRFEQVADNLRKGQAPLAQNAMILKVADRLPKDNKNAVGYLSVDQILALITNISNKVGQELPFPLNMPNAAPLAFSQTKVGEMAVQADVLIPAELIQSASQMIQPIIGMMMMGGLGGGPGMGNEIEDMEPAGQP
ncbi:MAG: hypothetical protein GXY44_05330 [Phycisphaerales bacterium]|nr:hypothetical protein [Phycisphaerales bacterium]